MKKTISILLACLLMIVLPLNSVKAEEDAIHIKTVDDWKQLAKDCVLDVYSKEKTVVLDNDLTFENDFVSISYFNGTFDGNNHKLINVNFDSYLINDGIFRITGKNSIIKNITIDMDIYQDSKRFGVVGYNQGLIENINVASIINGDDEIGLIVGYNAVTGKIKKCTSSGTIDGKHYIGGIVGINYGYITDCTNKANINNNIEKEDLEISTLTIESLTDSNIISKLNDIGGIAGINYGIIENCKNYGNIGHEHVGYNVGGVVGGQSGFVNNCTNYGFVQGRKEVGGIVGQAEPSMSLIFREDYLQSMKRQIKNIYEESNSIVDDLKANKDTNISYFEDVIDNLDQACDALDMMNGHAPGDTEYDTGKTALSSSIRKALDTSKNIVEYNKDTNDVYSRMKNVSQNLMDLGTTTVNFADSITTEKDTYVDVSNKDKSTDKEGKIANCINRSNVEGDINVGGITGSMAIENNLNPEDDFKIVGATSFDARYEIKDVIDSCINYGMIVIKRSCAGGICGNQTTGLIKKSINFGLLNCEEGNYVGGIAGKTIGNLDNNQSKCFIFGKDYVGGIAGTGEKGSNNGSISQILSYNSNSGSIFGNYGKIDDEIAEKATEISNNWYVYDELAGIDGISYDKKAFLISYDEMLKKDINDELKNINIIFMDDGNIVSKKTIEYGENVSKDIFPYEFNSDNDYCSWDSFDGNDLKNVTRDVLLVSNCTDVLPSISSDEDPLAYVVLNGRFNDTDYVKTIITEDDNGIEYSIKTSLAEDSSIDSYSIYANQYNKYQVLLLEDGKWNAADFKEDGRYAIVYSDGININKIRIVKVIDYTPIILGCGAVVLIAVGSFALIRGKKKNKNKAK